MVMTTTSANEMQGENRARDFTQSKVGRPLELLSRISLSRLSQCSGEWGVNLGLLALVDVPLVHRLLQVKSHNGSPFPLLAH